jgi:hypothetical protein
MLADDLLDDAKHLAAKGQAEERESCMRRAISTAYYAVFNLLVDDFIKHWPFPEQRARLARMFKHERMRDAVCRPKDKNKPTPVEIEVMNFITSFGQLQGDRHRADYDLGWKLVDTDVRNAITLAEEMFVKWRALRGEDAARNHLLSMFGANR